MKFTRGRGVPAAAHVVLAGHADPRVRRRSVLQLGASGAAAIGEEGIAALRRATGDADKLVAWEAITALGMLGEAAAPAIPRLEELARSDDKAKAARAKAALRSIRAGK